MSTREVLESPVYQGANEELAYQFDFTTWGTPTTPVVTITDLSTDTDVSATNLSGVASIAGYKVTTPKVIDILPGREYRLECGATVAGNLMSMYVVIVAEA